MINASDKYHYYNILKKKLTATGFIVNPYKEIQYGIQFVIFHGEQDALLRIYDGKKGLRLDMSQVKNVTLLAKLEEGLDYEKKPVSTPVKFEEEKPETDPEELIGVDESGKGDYFGPLVTAACYVNAETRVILKDLGIMDSKKMTDEKIREVAPLIKHHCVHSLVVMGNESYNDIYEDIQNLNYILAWSHANVIEKTVSQVPCKDALSDQFGKASLVKNALIAKGVQINLSQRHKAESNIAVAAASVLARDTYLEELDKMSKSFKMTFPKGASKKVIETAASFCKEYSRENLDTVAKIHFSTTKSVEELIQN